MSFLGAQPRSFHIVVRSMSCNPLSGAENASSYLIGPALGPNLGG